MCHQWKYTVKNAEMFEHINTIRMTMRCISIHKQSVLYYPSIYDYDDLFSISEFKLLLVYFPLISLYVIQALKIAP